MILDVVLAAALATAETSPPAAAARIPPGEAAAKAALDHSPRHGEWIDVPGPNGQALRSFVVYPERADRAPIVIVIHEIYGLTDWIRAVADQLAADGFVAVAPDLLSGKGVAGGGTESIPSRDDVVQRIRGLTSDEVSARLDAVRTWAVALPAASGKSATLGFCWGGGQSFAYAAHQAALGAAVVYYGTAPSEPAELARVKAPILGLYGGDDARVNATIAPAEAELKRLGRSYEAVLHDGAGHGFLRAQDGRDGANLRAAEAAWPRTIEFLRKHLEPAPAARP